LFQFLFFTGSKIAGHSHHRVSLSLPDDYFITDEWPTIFSEHKY